MGVDIIFGERGGEGGKGARIKNGTISKNVTAK
jgi:hypothetical protein